MKKTSMVSFFFWGTVICPFQASAFEVESGQASDALHRSVENGRSENSKMDAEYKLRRAEKRKRSEGSKGGSLNCSSVAKDYALYNYCDAGDCAGFSLDFSLYRLCEHNDADAMSKNYNIWRYLKNGEVGGFDNYVVHQRAKAESASFSDRKRFVIYYLRGFIFGE